MTLEELEQIEKMMEYYKVKDTTKLMMAMADHIERLQRQAESQSLRAVRLISPREG